jgi:hypothetical protein
MPCHRYGWVPVRYVMVPLSPCILHRAVALHIGGLGRPCFWLVLLRARGLSVSAISLVVDSRKNINDNILSKYLFCLLLLLLCIGCLYNIYTVYTVCIISQSQICYADHTIVAVCNVSDRGSSCHHISTTVYIICTIHIYCCVFLMHSAGKL